VTTNASLVLDPSVAVKWYVKEVDSAVSVEFQKWIQETAGRLIVPPLFFYEIANILWKKEILRKEVFPKAAKQILWEILQLPLQVYLDRHEMLPRALDIAAEMRVSVYDAIYLATTVQNQAIFVTADDRLVRKLSTTLLAPSVISLDRWTYLK
jgi:predicted nucleic acid-binding protein